jgi:hypothetical protein
MRYSNRLFLYAPLFVLLALAIIAALRWQAVAGGLETWLRQHNGREIAPGVTLHFASESVSGFPFNVDAVLHDVTFEVKATRTSAAWHADAFAIHELTFGRAQLIYEAAGSQNISWNDAQGGAHHLSFVPGSLQASAILSRGRLVRFDLDLNGIGSREITGARLQLHFRKAPDRDAIDIVASADQIHLDPSVQAGFGANIRHAAIVGCFVPAKPFGALFDGQLPWDRAMDAWRRDGGAFQIANFDMNGDSVQLHASGKLGLEDDHRPRGMLAVDLNGSVAAPTAGTAGDRLARAIARLTKVTKGTANSLSISIVSGDVNVRLTKAQQIAADAGKVGPVY